jgi:hypothetical protein
VNDALNLANAGMAERDQLNDHLKDYYINAASPMMPAYDLLKTMQADHVASNKKDTIVSQKSGPCFITTAVCEYLGKPDDCFELTTFRNFRDMWMRLRPGGNEMVRMYYKAAPRLVKEINASPDKDEIYKIIREEYLNPCLGFIRDREYERCRDRYMEMVFMLMETFPDEDESEAE